MRHPGLRRYPESPWSFPARTKATGVSVLNPVLASRFATKLLLICHCLHRERCYRQNFWRSRLQGERKPPSAVSVTRSGMLCFTYRKNPSTSKSARRASLDYA
jgi:hypothetical protein